MHVPADDPETPASIEPSPAASSFYKNFALLGCGLAAGLLSATLATHVYKQGQRFDASLERLEKTLGRARVRDHDAMIRICDSLDKFYEKYPKQEPSVSFMERCRSTRAGEDLVP